VNSHFVFFLSFNFCDLFIYFLCVFSGRIFFFIIKKYSFPERINAFVVALKIKTGAVQNVKNIREALENLESAKPNVT